MRGNGVMGLDVGLDGLGSGWWYKARCKEYWACNARWRGGADLGDVGVQRALCSEGGLGRGP
jgi:hypothetical protein